MLKIGFCFVNTVLCYYLSNSSRDISFNNPFRNKIRITPNTITMPDIKPNIWVYPRVSVNPASFPEIILEKKKLKYHAPIAREPYFAGANLLNIAIPIGDRQSSPTVNKK